MQDQPLDRDALHAILDFHVEAGVDLALDEAPHDRFAETPLLRGDEIPRLPPLPTGPPRPIPPFGNRRSAAACGRRRPGAG